MKSLLAHFVAIIAVLAGTGRSAQAEMPQMLNVGGQKLTLNGVGSRYKSFIQLYDAGLYLPAKTANAARIIAADVPMGIRIEITSIFVSQSNIASALHEGFRKSTGGNTARLRNEIDAFRRCFSEAISKGDIFDIIHIPSRGVMVTKNGQQKGVIQGMAFKQAVFGIWLGPSPADTSLKNAMLGIR